MGTDWETQFSSWALPPGKTEQDRIDNTILAVRKAMDADDFLKPRTKVFVQGSYRNRVNVRQDSDVDIGVLYTGNTFYPDYPEGTTAETFGNIDGDYNYSEFKNRVGQALIDRFGASAVMRGNKAFDVHENSYRVDCDVVPVFEHRRYRRDGDYICGVQLFPDNGGKIINWPERLFDNSHWPDQHYENGVAKNSSTSRAYKGCVRILKKLRNRMDEEGLADAKPIPGFLIECLMWNVPNDLLNHNSWDGDIQSALLHLYSNLKSKETCDEWGEVSELKYLFQGSPDSKRIDAFNFIDSVWSYIGVR